MLLDGFSLFIDRAVTYTIRVGRRGEALSWSVNRQARGALRGERLVNNARQICGSGPGLQCNCLAEILAPGASSINV